MHTSSPKIHHIETKTPSNYVTISNTPSQINSNFYSPKSQTKN